MTILHEENSANLIKTARLLRVRF